MTTLTTIPAIPNTPSAWSERARTVEAPHEAVMWSQQGALDRYNAVATALAPCRRFSSAPLTLLDFGCGLGGFSPWVPGRTEYVGYDWADGMVERARELHPTHTFTSSHPGGYFDFTVAIGTFNLKDGWTRTRTWAMLGGLWRRTRRALVASLYYGSDQDCISYSPIQVLEFAQRLCDDWTVARHRANDVIVVMRR